MRTNPTADDMRTVPARLLDAIVEGIADDEAVGEPTCRTANAARELIAWTTDNPQAAATERAAVVTWLRGAGREADETLAEMDADAPGRVPLQTAASCYQTAADMIEEGAHHA